MILLSRCPAALSNGARSVSDSILVVSAKSGLRTAPLAANVKDERDVFDEGYQWEAPPSSPRPPLRSQNYAHWGYQQPCGNTEEYMPGVIPAYDNEYDDEYDDEYDNEYDDEYDGYSKYSCEDYGGDFDDEDDTPHLLMGISFDYGEADLGEPRRVRFAHRIVTDTWERPRILESEVKDLFYTESDYRKFEMEAKRHRSLADKVQGMQSIRAKF